jgi:hypothetical protein
MPIAINSLRFRLNLDKRAWYLQNKLNSLTELKVHAKGQINSAQKVLSVHAE